MYQVMDIIVWLRIFIDEHPNIEENRKLWTIKARDDLNQDGWIKGEISEVEEDGSGRFLSEQLKYQVYIPSRLVEKFKLSKGLTVSVNIGERDGKKDWIFDIKTESDGL